MADELSAAGHELIFAGTPQGMEARLAREAGIEFLAIRSYGWDRSRPWTILVAACVMAVATADALAALARRRPDVVAAFGGYVSIPFGVAAALTRTPLVIAEQNAVPGLANRVLSRWATAVSIAFESSRGLLRRPERATLTGNPVRPSVLSASRDAGRAMFGAQADQPTLLVFGGSRGARHINQATVRAHDALMGVDGLRVLHVAGRTEAENLRQELSSVPGWDPARYHVVDYVDRMGDALAGADLVVARAGATSIAEITVVGRAAVLVPYPFATDDHQSLNARSVADAGAAVVVEDADLDGEGYVRTLLSLLKDGAERSRMARASATLGRPHAAAAFARLAVESARYAGSAR